MNINIDKKKMQQIGKTALKIGRQIVIQGTVSVTAKGVANGLEIGLNQGFDKIKKMSVEDFLGIDDKREEDADDQRSRGSRSDQGRNSFRRR